MDKQKILKNENRRNIEFQCTKFECFKTIIIKGPDLWV